MYTIVSTDGCPSQNFVVSRRKWSLFVQFFIFYLKMHVNLLVHCMIVTQDMTLLTILFPDNSFSKLSPKSYFFKLLWLRLSIDPLKKDTVTIGVGNLLDPAGRNNKSVWKILYAIFFYWNIYGVSHRAELSHSDAVDYWALCLRSGGVSYWEEQVLRESFQVSTQYFAHQIEALNTKLIFSFALSLGNHIGGRSNIFKWRARWRDLVGRGCRPLILTL